jgi:hypothetical protein
MFDILFTITLKSLTVLNLLKYNGVMNTLDKTKRTQLISTLIEGNSLRGTARICRVAFNTVLKFIPEIGQLVLNIRVKLSAI